MWYRYCCITPRDFPRYSLTSNSCSIVISLACNIMMCLAIAGPGNYDARVHIGYIMMHTAIAGPDNCDLLI